MNRKRRKLARALTDAFIEERLGAHPRHRHVGLPMLAQGLQLLADPLGRLVEHVDLSGQPISDLGSARWITVEGERVRPAR